MSSVISKLHESQSCEEECDSISLSRKEQQLIKRDLLARQIHGEIDRFRSTLSLNHLVHDQSLLQPLADSRNHFFLHFLNRKRDSSLDLTKTNSDIDVSLLPARYDDTPLLRFAFTQFVLTFPFLKGVNPNFWPKIQQFLQAFNEHRSGTRSIDPKRNRKQDKIASKLEKILVLLFNTGIPTSIENSVPTKSKQKTTPKETPTIKSNSLSNSPEHLPFVEIVSVRRQVKKTFLIQKEKAMFIVKCSLPDWEGDLYVLRSYSQFTRYFNQIRHAFPTFELPSPPPKFKNASQDIYFREKDRISLQNYIRNILRNPLILQSQATRNFLTFTPIEMEEDDLFDIERRKQHMTNRNHEYQKIMRMTEEKAEELKETIGQFKKELLHEGGFKSFSDTLHDIPNISGLPSHYRKLIELFTINFAFTLYRVFCADDSATCNFHQLKQTHSLIPYRTLGGILRIANPTIMMKGVLDLFLAQPFGQPSILQSRKKEEIKRIEGTISEIALCEKVHNYIYLSENPKWDNEQVENDLDRLIQAILDPNISPPITPETGLILSESLKYLKEANLVDSLMNLAISGSNEDSDIDEKMCSYGENEMTLKKLYRIMILHGQIRETENVIKLVFEGVTGELLKEILTIFYQPLAQIYKDANISDFITSSSKFIEDLIKVVEETNRSPDHSAIDTLKRFTKLVESHQEIFYQFVHSLYKQRRDGLFQQLIGWFEHILGTLRDGIVSEAIDLEDIIRTNIEATENTEFQAEVHTLKEYTFRTKLRQFRKLTQKMLANTEPDILYTAGTPIPKEVLSRLLRSSGLSHISEDSDLLKDIKLSKEGDANEEMTQEIQEIEFEDINISLDDMLEVQSSTVDDSEEEFIGNWTSVPQSKSQFVEPKLDYPEFKLLPKLAKPFMTRILQLLTPQF
ncbi:hypothetical protein K7432_005078 [Basidiobolus ranarum]|uniref:PX domain-containing protein n=1 Tax=Basidiobolus ranarum TaxID=34480 RepID=A0ABR2WX39_9FUNG